MKKLPAILAIILLLAGCAVQEDMETSQTTETVAETQPQGIYMPDSTVEQQSGGAVRQYTLDEAGYQHICMLGDKLLLITREQQPELQLYYGDTCIPGARAALPQGFDLTQNSWRTTYHGFVYYDSSAKTAVFLDPQLQEQNRVQLPDEAQGNPVFSADGNEIFYCVDQKIYGLDVERGLSRLIRSFEGRTPTLLDCLFENKILSCKLENTEGDLQTIYISAQTGETCGTDENVAKLDTYEEQFLAIRMDGVVEQRLFGSREGETQQLTIMDGKVVAALELGGSVNWQTDSDGLHLDFYDHTAGVKTASLTLQAAGELQAVCADRWSETLWLLTEEAQSETQMLLQWDIHSSQVTEEASVVSPLYTADAPDSAGLEACQNRVDALDDAHGVRIRIWQNAIKYSNGEVLEAEHQPFAIDHVLDELEKVFALLPENFLYKSVNSRIRICIVRSIDSQVAGKHYWNDGDAFIVLSAGADIQNEFIKALGYIVDSHVLGNSPNYDYWDETNPEGFVYGDAATYSQDYLQGEQMAFLDQESMDSVVTDRSHIFWQAMKGDNAALFQSEAMQNKLRSLCLAIRDAWRLERKKDVYHWEQYLQESIAYQG